MPKTVWLTFEWDAPEGEIFTVDVRYRVTEGLPATRTEPAEPPEFTLVNYEVSDAFGSPLTTSFPPSYEEKLLEFLEDPERMDDIQRYFDEADAPDDY